MLLTFFVHVQRCTATDGVHSLDHSLVPAVRGCPEVHSFAPSVLIQPAVEIDLSLALMSIVI